ncbi:hypothetical protein BKA65DRAFT_569816 [Rhexocercosporidium sp. MPI-PUGE-AT-0058]|nr:hypothetical protein BKA65DRAFT_569816 [Rhexocercosporidium sp. MPI-PUGE-AT-0058]
MASPAAKKQKTSPDPPIIFTTARQKPDVRMFVFNQEFHVYSGVLKMNAAFFETMLEPSGGMKPRSTSPLFKSDWFTALDADLGWVLSFDHKCKHENLSTFKGSVMSEQRAFINLLSAIFSREYELADANELKSMTNLADYYRALPIVSYSLSGTIYSSPGFITSIGYDPCTILISASKLRHKLLFREGFISALGPWSKPRYRKLKHSHPELFKLADAAYKTVDAKISKLTRELFQIAADNSIPPKKKGKACPKLVQDVISSSYEYVDKEGKILWPMFVENCKHCVHCDTSYQPLLTLLGELLQNESVLNKKAVVGENCFEDQFMCFALSDAELPWDTTQIDF